MRFIQKNIWMIHTILSDVCNDGEVCYLWPRSWFVLYKIYMLSCLQRVNEINFFTESLAVRYFENNAMCTKNGGFKIFEVRNQNWCKHTSGFEITFILEFLAFVS